MGALIGIGVLGLIFGAVWAYGSWLESGMKPRSFDTAVGGVTSRGMPKKAHTIRMRLNAFVAAVRVEDASIDVQMQPLRGRR